MTSRKYVMQGQNINMYGAFAKFCLTDKNNFTGFNSTFFDRFKFFYLKKMLLCTTLLGQ